MIELIWMVSHGQKMEKDRNKNVVSAKNEVLKHD